MGLPHCETPHCIMESGKEKVSTVDEGWNDLCEACKKKLGWQ
jgi:predicted Zn-dependent protease